MAAAGPVSQDWVPCSDTSACGTLGRHNNATLGYSTPELSVAEVPFETFTPTRLFCSVSAETRVAAGGVPPPPGAAGYCASCFDCATDADAVEGSCIAACGLPATASFPALGLPAAVGLWPAVALLDVQALFLSSLWAAANPNNSASSAPPAPATVQQLGAAAADASQFPALLRDAGLSHGRSAAGVSHTFETFDSDGSGTVTPTEFFISTLLSEGERNQYPLFCGASGVGSGVSGGGGTVGPGCFCNSGIPDLVSESLLVEDVGPLQEQLRLTPSGSPGTSGWESLVQGSRVLSPACDAGMRCSRRAFLWARPLLVHRALSVFFGVCVPCMLGESCPVAMREQNEGQLRDCRQLNNLTKAVSTWGLG